MRDICADAYGTASVPGIAQFTIKWPNGGELTYEGDVSFNELLDLLNREAPPFLAGTSNPAPPRVDGSPRVEEAADPALPPLDVRVLDRQMQEVEAATDVERVTVFAQAALDSGRSGIDIPTAENLYRELALRMPGNWRSTFSNAQTRGYLRIAERGVWRTTAAGENFARRGERRPSAVRRRRRRAEPA